MMRKIFIGLGILISSALLAQTNEKIPVLIRCDDIGMCHSVNVAAEQVLKTGIPVSMSVMVPCPWFAEAVEILKKYPNVSIGIHLTLNSEWKQYRWGPVDANPFGPKNMSKHRHAELNALISPQFQQLLHETQYRLVNYGMLVREQGLSAMKRPS